MKRIYTHIIQDPLYVNSLFTMSSTFISAGLGFVFWIIIARIFKIEAVGIATALISTLTLIVNFSDLGFNIGILRYLPQSQNRNELISSACLIIGIVTSAIAIIFILTTPFVSKEVVFLQKNLFFSLTFIILVMFAAWNNLIDSIFKSYRAARHVLYRNIVLSIAKLAFPFTLLFLGAYGIFLSVALSTMITCLLGYIILQKKFSFHFHIARKAASIKQIGVFSLMSYVSSFFSQLPLLLLPLIIIRYLPPSFVAYYYIDAMILNFLVVIPVSVTQMLLAEGSYDAKALRQHLKKAIAVIMLLLIPAVLLLIFFGKYILLVFGSAYASHAVVFLQLLSLSSICTAITLLGSATLRVKHKIKTLVGISCIGSCLVFGFCFAFLSRGLTGIGWGWFLGQALTSGIFLGFLIKELRESSS